MVFANLNLLIPVFVAIYFINARMVKSVHGVTVWVLSEVSATKTKKFNLEKSYVIATSSVTSHRMDADPEMEFSLPHIQKIAHPISKYVWMVPLSVEVVKKTIACLIHVLLTTQMLLVVRLDSQRPCSLLRVSFL